MRILLAEPHAQVLRALRTLFNETTEHSVVGEVFNLDDLLLKVQEKQPDVVLLDWDLPGLTRSKLKKATSARDHFPWLIVMSSKSGIEQEIFEAGADAFVSKGTPPNKLLEALKQVQDDLTANPPREKEDMQ